MTPPAFTVEDLEARIRGAGHSITLAGTVTPEVAAEVLGLNAGTLRNWRTFDRGPRWLTIAGRVWYQTAALVDYLNAAGQDAA